MQSLFLLETSFSEGSSSRVNPAQLREPHMSAKHPPSLWVTGRAGACGSALQPHPTAPAVPVGHAALPDVDLVVMATAGTGKLSLVMSCNS